MNDPVSASQRLYRALLQAYPPSFRAEYGEEMALAFRDSCRAAHRRGGAAGVLGQWVETVPDVVVSVVDEHAQENFQMAKTNLARLLALAGLASGALWIAFSVLMALRAPGIPDGPSRMVDDLGPLIYCGVGLTAAVTLGVYLRPGRDWPAVSRWFLLLSAAGGLWILATGSFTDNFYVFLAGFVAQMLALLIGGLSLLASTVARSWAAQLIACALAMFLFNTEDWRALFGVAVGILAIVISARMFAETLSRPSQPPVAAD